MSFEMFSSFNEKHALFVHYIAQSAKIPFEFMINDSDNP